MLETIQIVRKSERKILLSVADPSMLDKQMEKRIALDELALPVTIVDASEGLMEITLIENISLSQYLEAYHFEHREAYQFMQTLLEKAINVNRSKPVLLDPDYIFLNARGENLRFCALPLGLEHWMFQSRDVHNLISRISRQFKTSAAYEIPGYLFTLEDQESISLPHVLFGLQNLQGRYCKKRYFWQKQMIEPYKGRYAITPIKNEESEERKENLFDFLEQMKTEKKESARSSIPDPAMMETRILPMETRSGAWIELEGVRYELPFEEILIGRHISCDIRLESEEISLRHARITQSNERWYFQDLKSSNGSWLDEKKVIRKMRLKDGMKVVLGSVQGVFHEQPL